jgi:hypothetical protein
MTERKINLDLKKIESAKKQGYWLEALLKNYQLNIQLIKFLLKSGTKNPSLDTVKIKQLMALFIEEVSVNSDLKTIISKKNLKFVKPWLSKMEDFLKALKQGEIKNAKTLQQESETVFGVLHISAAKLLLLSKRSS